ncbi:MAG: hypothetical protein KatS3mg124_0615 [Porticoccaceae bacterium]|nr:MAG: hypothetical protein KatS3mg124_0615 [Porticoccaceae bacterium]
MDRAVAAARRAFPRWSASTREERLALLERILEEYQRRLPDLGDAITAEMGAPRGLAHGFQVQLGLGHLTTAIEVLRNFAFEEARGPSLIVKEPIGVCGLITPWNWPVNQVTVKVFPALATGCTVVLKPSQEAHFSAHVLAEIFDAAGVPAGGVQPGPGAGFRGGRGHRQPPRSGHGLHHRLRGGWRPGGHRRRPRREAGVPGIGGQERPHHPGRRKSCPNTWREASPG